MWRGKGKGNLWECGKLADTRFSKEADHDLRIFLATLHNDWPNPDEPMKRFFATCFLLPLQLVFGEGEAGPVVALVTEPPKSGCYQLVEVVDAEGNKINEATPGEVERIRSTFKNLSDQNFFLAKNTTGPWDLRVEFVCNDFESWKAALGEGHSSANKEIFEAMDGVLNTRFLGPFFWGGGDKEWIFLHRTPPAGAMICGCVEWGRSYRSFEDIKLDTMAWDECKFTFSRRLNVMGPVGQEPRVQDGEIVLRIQRKAVDAAAGQPKEPTPTSGARFQIFQESGGNSKETVVFADPAIPPVEMPAYQWPGKYSVSPGGHARQVKGGDFT